MFWRPAGCATREEGVVGEDDAVSGAHGIDVVRNGAVERDVREGGGRGRDNCTAECPGRSTVLESDLPTIVVCRE
jgi:hypothetical protein